MNKFRNNFGIETSVNMLQEASGVSDNEIFLYSVELFYKQMAFYNLKIAAHNAEQQAAFERAQQQAKLKRDTKKR